jgi:hypothetical protein
MSSEQVEKQLMLIGGSISALIAIVGGFSELFGKIGALKNLPSGVSWLAYAGLFLVGLWLLIKWRTRHSRLLKPDALRLDRENPQHLVGRAEDIDNLFNRCLAKQIVFLEGESGSGKSALVRSGLLPRLRDEKSILPLMLADLWVEHWERSPSQALRAAMIKSGEFASDATLKPAEGAPILPTRPLSTLDGIEQRLARLSDEQERTALIIFDQFDDYQARNRGRRPQARPVRCVPSRLKLLVNRLGPGVDRVLQGVAARRVLSEPLLPPALPRGVSVFVGDGLGLDFVLFLNQPIVPRRQDPLHPATLRSDADQGHE